MNLLRTVLATVLLICFVGSTLTGCVTTVAATPTQQLITIGQFKTYRAEEFYIRGVSQHIRGHLNKVNLYKSNPRKLLVGVADIIERYGYTSGKYAVALETHVDKKGRLIITVYVRILGGFKVWKISFALAIDDKNNPARRLESCMWKGECI